MNGTTLTDDTGTIELTVLQGRVTSVRISNRWRDRYDTAALGEALSQLIRQSLPARAELAQPEFHDRHLPMDSVPAYLAEMRAGRRAMRRYLERLRAGEVRRSAEERLTDPDNRAEVAVVGGRFAALFLNPEWAEETGIQALCDTILRILPDPLVREAPIDPDIAEALKHFDAARSLQAEK